MSNFIYKSEDQAELFGVAISRACAITFEQNALCVATPYNSGFVAEFKSKIPAGARSYDPPTKRWFVEVRYGTLLIELIKNWFGETVELPAAHTVAQIVTDTFRVEYIGRCKARDAATTTPIAFCISGNQISPLAADESLATGFANGAWCLLFPEAVLKTWFEGDQSAQEVQTLYTLLGVKQKVNEQKLKSAYKAAARTWHPDICSEPDAADRFRQINEAWRVLGNPVMRRRYDAGLSFEKDQAKEKTKQDRRKDLYGYAPLLRCGMVKLAGARTAGKIKVSEILAWDDIADERGFVMTSAWDKKRQEFVTDWVNPHNTAF